VKVRPLALAALVIVGPRAAVAQRAPLPASSLPQAVSCTTPSAATTNPFVWAIINGSCTNLTRYLVAGSTAGTWSLSTPMLELSGATIKLDAVLDGDPFITFGATTTNTIAGEVTYAFLFGTPIVPGFYSAATSTGGVTVTNGAGGTATVATGSIYPTYISGYGSLGGSATNLGVDLGTAACTASGPPATVTQVCNQGNASSTFAPTFYDNLEALLTYTQTDLASVASWSGAITLGVSVTPEPATLALIAPGLLMVVVGVSRTRKRPDA
jgi:hypothetical protein